LKKIRNQRKKNPCKVEGCRLRNVVTHDENLKGLKVTREKKVMKNAKATVEKGEKHHTQTRKKGNVVETPLLPAWMAKARKNYWKEKQEKLVAP